MVKWVQSPRENVKSHLEKKSSNEQGNAHYGPRPAEMLDFDKPASMFYLHEHHLANWQLTDTAWSWRQNFYIIWQMGRITGLQEMPYFFQIIARGLLRAKTSQSYSCPRICHIYLYTNRVTRCWIYVRPGLKCVVFLVNTVAIVGDHHICWPYKTALAYSQSAKLSKY